METVQQDAFAMKELLDEGGEGPTGLAWAMLEAGVNEMMSAQADAMCEATEDWSSRRYMEPSAIEGLWEREAAPAADPTEEQVSRARSRAIALSGLDEGAMAA